MNRLRDILICIVLAAFAFATVMVMFALCRLLDTTANTVGALPEEIRVTRSEILAEISNGRKDLTQQITAARGDVTAAIESYRETADRRLGNALDRYDSTLHVVDSRTGEALDTVEALRSDVAPVLQNASAIEQHADRTVIDLHPQLLGLIAASKVTAGETAQTMKSIRDAVPAFISQGERITANADRLTEESADVAQNLNRLTKPKWYDRLIGYGLSFGAAYRDLNPGYNAGQAIRGMFTKQK